MDQKFNINIYMEQKRIPVTVTVMGDKLQLAFRFFRPLIDEVKVMEGREWVPDKKVWRIANSRRNIFALDTLMNGERIKHYDRKIPAESFPGNWKHQDDMENFIFTRRRCLLAAEMRTGKTRPTLDVIVRTNCEAFWVAPLRALKGIEREIKKWDIDPTLVHLITYDALRTIWASGINEVAIPQFVVFDECQKLKTPTTQQTKAAMFLSDAMANKYDGEEFVVGLSGTPSPKNPGDWWSICEVIQPGFIREGTRAAFERRLGTFEQREGAVGNMYWHLLEWKEREVKFLQQRLAPLVQIHLKKDCLDLPSKMYEVRDIEPSKKVLRVAKTIADNEMSVLQAINKLRQLSDGFQYQYGYDEERNVKTRTETKFVGSPKLDELKADLENHNDIGRIIIYAGFQGSVDLIVKTCVDAGWTVLQCDGRGWQVHHAENPDDAEGVVMWSTDDCLEQMDRSTNDGRISKLAFVANPESGGTGLELSASPTIIYYSNTNRGEARMQSEDRAHSANMDTNRGLTIVDYVYLPVDRTVRDSLIEKKDLQNLSMGVLKEVLNG